MSKAELDKAVADTAKSVESWQSNIKAIEAQIASAHSRLEKSEAQRKRFALDASLGNAQATAEIAKARAEAAAAAGDQSDLGHALSQSKEKLIEAEREATIARNNLARFATEILMRRRIDLAGQLDKVIDEFSRLHSEYEKLGTEIVNMDVLPQHAHGITNHHDGALGARRVRAALPKLFDRVYPNALHDESKKEPLATTEARHWNLPPAETTTTKAA
jgi:Tfp pilus assembly protein FimV